LVVQALRAGALSLQQLPAGTLLDEHDCHVPYKALQDEASVTTHVLSVGQAGAGGGMGADLGTQGVNQGAVHTLKASFQRIAQQLRG